MSFLLIVLGLCFAEEITPISQGEVSPFSGVVMTEENLRQLLAKIEFEKQVCEIEVKKNVKLQELENNYLLIHKDADLKACEYQLENIGYEFSDYRAKKQELMIKQNSKTLFWASSGFITGVGFMALSAWTYSKIK